MFFVFNWIYCFIYFQRLFSNGLQQTKKNRWESKWSNCFSINTNVVWLNLRSALRYYKSIGPVEISCLCKFYYLLYCNDSHCVYFDIQISTFWIFWLMVCFYNCNVELIHYVLYNNLVSHRLECFSWGSNKKAINWK